MTDTPDARAHPPDDPATQPPTPRRSREPGTPGGQPPAPAAHAHPTRASVNGTAVLDTKPAELAPAFGWAAASTGEPPPFGFNAPSKPEETEAALNGSPSQSPGRAGANTVDAPAPDAELAPVAEPDAVDAPGRPSSVPPSIDRPFSIPTRPPTSSLAPPAAQPRELMPSAYTAPQRRLGETITPTFGPPGRRRSPGVMALLSVLTLGVYAIAWHRRVNQEMGDFDPRIHVHPARSAWAVFLPWFAGLLGSAAAAGIVVSSHYGVDLHLGVTAHQVLPGVAALAAVPYLVFFLPFSLVAVVRTAERVRMVEEHAGVTTDEQIRPAAVVGWLIVPIIGGLVLMGRQQGHLNRIWVLA